MEFDRFVPIVLLRVLPDSLSRLPGALGGILASTR